MMARRRTGVDGVFAVAAAHGLGYSGRQSGRIHPMTPSSDPSPQREIEDLRHMQQALHESEARHRAIVDAALDAIIMIDSGSRITEFNPAAEAIFGWRREQVIGRDLGEAIIPPAMREAHRRGLERHRDSPNAPRLGVRLELTALRADGAEFPVELTVCRLSAGGEPRFTAFIRDITERRRAEDETVRLKAELEERVRQRTAQLEAANAELEAFSYSIAHDLRSPLTSIDGFSHALEESCLPALDDQGQHYLRRIRAGVRQMSDLTEAMLSLAHLSSVMLRCEPVDLAETARAVLARLRENEPQREATLEAPARLFAQGDPRLLTQVVANLVGNAWKFSARKPQTRISLGASQAGGETVFFVADRGAGFDMAHASRLFGAFQRLHAPSEFEGTGIGLALVQKIVTRHGGRIWARAEPGEGATFYFTLAGDAAA
jgi:PAS domain S-box-containing protein